MNCFRFSMDKEGFERELVDESSDSENDWLFDFEEDTCPWGRSEGESELDWYEVEMCYLFNSPFGYRYLSRINPADGETVEDTIWFSVDSMWRDWEAENRVDPKQWEHELREYEEERLQQEERRKLLAQYQRIFPLLSREPYNLTFM